MSPGDLGQMQILIKYDYIKKRIPVGNISHPYQKHKPEKIIHSIRISNHKLMIECGR
jgi:hypothetical protein